MAAKTATAYHKLVAAQKKNGVFALNVLKTKITD